jgi:uncharacterized protein (DUF924 family)
MDSADVLRFWFEETEPQQWWRADAGFDDVVRSRFGELQARATRDGLPEWRVDAPGRLAEVIMLDQFSRNIHRGTPAAFGSDARALELSKEAISLGLAAQLVPVQRAFLYLPFMHSEDARDHVQAMVLFKEPGLEPNLASEVRHKAIIDRFGRYPHRNAILGRESTPEEIAFLKTPGSSF